MKRVLACTLLSLTLTGPCLAERADRDKPLTLEADRVSIDDAKKVQVLEGDVIITKGTIVIRANKVVITEDQYGFQNSVATGGKDGLARFKQKREGKDEYVEGEGERIDYNTAKEVAELFRRAWFKSGEDVVRGDYIRYDAINERYNVNAGDNKDPKAPPTRVRAVIQPKNKPALPEADAPSSGNLKGSEKLSVPPAEPR